MRRRHKARRWTLQILYAWEVRGRERDLEAEAADFFTRRQLASQTRDYAERLIDSLSTNLPEIDAALAGAAENWDLERMAIIDRNILRIAVAELLHVDDVPWKVAIDEAVTLASRYGGADSPRFVNGVLDALAHKLNLQVVEMGKEARADGACGADTRNEEEGDAQHLRLRETQ